MGNETLKDLEPKVDAGEMFTRADAARVLACADLVVVGMLSDRARRARRGDRITFGRVAAFTPGRVLEAAHVADAGEVRITAVPASAAEARAWVREAAPQVGTVLLTGYSLGDLLQMANGDHLALADLARSLRADGLVAVAETPMDRLGDTENAIEVVRAALHGGLGVWRATIDAAGLEDRLDLIERAADVQRATQTLRAFAPLPRQDPADTPATGYDDVRTVALARLMCPSIPSIQVDWPLYGPKLAQVALGYGADDVDGVAVEDTLNLGHRRSPREDIERQIRAAAATPVERTGRYESRA